MDTCKACPRELATAVFSHRHTKLLANDEEIPAGILEATASPALAYGHHCNADVGLPLALIPKSLVLRPTLAQPHGPFCGNLKFVLPAHLCSSLHNGHDDGKINVVHNDESNDYNHAYPRREFVDAGMNQCVRAKTLYIFSPRADVVC